MRRFRLVRTEDTTGVSGTGVVAYGVAFPDGTVALRWCKGPVHSTVFYDSMEDMIQIHGHEGTTQAEWLDAVCRRGWDEGLHLGFYERIRLR